MQEKKRLRNRANGERCEERSTFHAIIFIAEQNMLQAISMKLLIAQPACASPKGRSLEEQRVGPRASNWVSAKLPA